MRQCKLRNSYGPFREGKKYVMELEPRFVSRPARIPVTYRLVTIVLFVKYQALPVRIKRQGCR